MQKVAVYSATRNLYPYMLPAVKSLLLNSDVEKIYFLIEDDDFPEPLPSEIECINMSDQKWFPETGVNYNRYFTYMAYLRAALPKIFPDLDVILSLDVDTIAVSDISDIWDMPLDDCYFSASREKFKTTPELPYYNTGVCLYNLKKMRDDGMDDRVIDMVNTVSLICPEQDALTQLCKGMIHEMPGEYNATNYTTFSEDPKLIHYAGMPNWFDQPELMEYSKYTWDDIAEYRKTKNFRETKKGHIRPMYMIHTCPQRKWYVDGYLLPSLVEQGIDKDDIIIWNDGDGVGNLESFARSAKWIGKTQTYLGGIWHLQDDVVISKQFKEITEKENKGIVCGFCNLQFDGGGVNRVGIMPVAFAWLSFQCIRLPNIYVKKFADWYYEDVVPNKRYSEWTADGKNDDALWRIYMVEKHPDECAYNMMKNIVDHIDYLIGGTIINGHRKGEQRRAYWWDEPDTITELEKKIAEYNAVSSNG